MILGEMKNGKRLSKCCYIKQRLKHKLNRKEIHKGNTRFNTSIP